MSSYSNEFLSEVLAWFRGTNLTAYAGWDLVRTDIVEDGSTVVTFTDPIGTVVTFVESPAPEKPAPKAPAKKTRKGEKDSAE